MFRPGCRLRVRPGSGHVGDEKPQHGDDFPECEGDGLMLGVTDGVSLRGGNRRFGWRGVRHPGCGAGGDGSRPRRPVEIRAGGDRCFYGRDDAWIQMAVGWTDNLFLRDDGSLVFGIMLMDDRCEVVFLRSGRTANKCENTGDYEDWLHSRYSVSKLNVFGYCRK